MLVGAATAAWEVGRIVPEPVVGLAVTVGFTAEGGIVIIGTVAVGTAVGIIVGIPGTTQAKYESLVTVA